MSAITPQHAAFLTKCHSALSACTFLPASWDKRFVRSIPADIRTTTERQRYWIVFMTKRYRKQIPHKDLVRQAEEWLGSNKVPA